MRKRSWWAAAGAAVAVAALVGVVAVMSAGSPGSGEADGPATGGANTGDTSTSDSGTSGSDARSAQPSGHGISGDTGTAVAPPATGQPAEPPMQPQPRPQPSVVAPRAQAPRPDLPLGLTIQSYELVAPDRLQVQYATGLPECYGALDRAYVSESGDRVLVTLRVRPVAQPSNRPCPDIALVKDTLVRLDQPLGDRAVVDGSSGRAVRRGHAPSPG
ncbi:MAG: hypothetical protein ACRDO0_02815 [Nocardioidaceae bacterium]